MSIQIRFSYKVRMGLIVCEALDKALRANGFHLLDLEHMLEIKELQDGRLKFSFGGGVRLFLDMEAKQTHFGESWVLTGLILSREGSDVVLPVNLFRQGCKLLPDTWEEFVKEVGIAALGRTPVQEMCEEVEGENICLQRPQGDVELPPTHEDFDEEFDILPATK